MGGPVGGLRPHGLAVETHRIHMACIHVQGIFIEQTLSNIVAKMLGVFVKNISRNRRYLAILSKDFGEKLSDLS